MTYMSQTYDEGTDGQNASITSLADSGTAPSLIVINNSSTPGGASNIVHSAAAGTLLGYDMGVRFTGSTNSTYLRWDDPEPGGRAVVRFPVYFTANPSVNVVLAMIRSASDANVATVFLDTAGRIAPAQGISIITAGRYTATASTVYWVEFVATKGTTTSDGRIEMYVYSADGITEIFSYDTGATVNTGTADMGIFRLGSASGGQGTLDPISMAGTAVGVLDSGLWGPVSNVNEPPVVTLSPDVQNVDESDIVSLTATADDPDGSIASRATIFDFPTSGAPTITDGDTENPTFTAPAAPFLGIVRQTVTDNDDDTGFDTAEVRVRATGSGTLLPLEMDGVEVGTWTLVGAATTDGEALADSDDATYVESEEVSAVEQEITVRLQPRTDLNSATVTVRLSVDTGFATATVRLRQGTGTVLEEWEQAVTTTPTDYEFVVAPTTVAAITDAGDLRISVAVSS